VIRWGIFLFALVAALPAAAKPRAVSLDYCADQYLLKLADDDQILAVSRDADKEFSYMRQAAAKYRKIRPAREEALALTPDIILRQWGGGMNAQEAFGAGGAQVVSLGHPENFGDVRENIRLAASALGQKNRGEALIAEMDSHLNALAQKRKPAWRALYVTPGGVTAGTRTMIDAIITAAGLINIAAAEGKSYWPPLPAEQLLLSPPEFIVGGFFISRDEKINHWSAARHPALNRLMADTPSVQLPTDLTSCAAWYSADAAELIATSTEE